MRSITSGTDKGGSFVTVVRLETEVRATLTEQQKALFEQINKTDVEITTGMGYTSSQAETGSHDSVSVSKIYTATGRGSHRPLPVFFFADSPRDFEHFVNSQFLRC